MKLKILLGSLLVAATSGSAALDRPPRLPPQPYHKLAAKYRVVHDFDICIVGMAGRVSCIRKQQVRDRLADMSGRDLTFITDAIDRINAGVGNRATSDILVHCLGEWRSAKAPRPGAVAFTASTKGRREMTGKRVADLRDDGVRTTCRAAVPGGGGTGNNAGFGYERQVASAVQGFDDAVDSCREPANSGIAQTYQGGGSLERYRISQAVGGEKEAEALLRLLLLTLETVETVHRAIEDAKAAGEKAAIENALRDYTPEEREAKQCQAEGQCLEKTTSVEMPIPPGVDGAMSCAAREASWKRFKDRCALSSWQSYECVAFVRMLGDCVDIRRIRPGPDGDLTCPAPQSEADRQALREKRKCDRLGGIGRPLPGGGFDCGPRRPIEKPKLGIDICTGPTTTPGPDTNCPAPRPNPR